MPHLFFAPSIQRHLPLLERDVAGRSVDEALFVVFGDRGGLRRHLAIFVGGKPRRRRSDAVETDSRIYVVQALSGG